MRVCVLGDQKHCDEATVEKIPFMTQDDLKKLNKEKKAIKKLAKSYDAFIASDALIKQIPRILGPGLNKAGKFPSVVTHNEKLGDKVDEIRATVKFQMKKVGRQPRVPATYLFTLQPISGPLPVSRHRPRGNEPRRAGVEHLPRRELPRLPIEEELAERALSLHQVVYGPAAENLLDGDGVEY